MKKNLSSIAFFPNIKSHGQLFPVDSLVNIQNKKLEGMKNTDYGLSKNENLHEAISRSWNRLRALWLNLAQTRKSLPENESASDFTRKNLLYPLFQELGYGRLDSATPKERKIKDEPDKSYPFSHIYKSSPIHLIGFNLSLDKRKAGVQGAARQSPHSMLQEFLNRSPEHLWGILSNGLSLRLLRKNASLSGQAYLEFNLENIFLEESISEFALLWLICHNSRLFSENEKIENCWLELWSKEAHRASVAALDNLHDNVCKAINILGQAFLRTNPLLKNRLAEKHVDGQEYFHQLLRLVYRLIFLFVIEERDLLHAPDLSGKIRELYHSYWSLARIRTLSQQIPGSKHSDLWESLKFVMRALGDVKGCPELGLSPLGGFLWSSQALPELEDLKLSNEDLLSTINALAFTKLEQEKRPVDFGHLGAQELGSIYESLLELQAQLKDGNFSLVYIPEKKEKKKSSSSGSERKTTGSYYTPDPLIQKLLENTLFPQIEKALQSADPKAALLNLKICDPACGSGHFLLAAARHIAKSLAQLETGDSEPSLEACRNSLKEVVNRCIYGIDINPMALEICKLGLWLETHEPGKPLSFLDHHLVCANSLIGTDSQSICAGIPEAAYNKELEGNNKKAVNALKQSARLQKESLNRPQFEQFEAEVKKLVDSVRPLSLDDLAANNLEEIEKREKLWREWQNSEEWQNKKFLYDLWTAAFLLPAAFPEGTSPHPENKAIGITWSTLLNFVNNRPLEPAIIEAVHKAAREYRFFHLEVMFPEVAAKGGFDVILANPPWKNALLKEKAWFTAHDREDIAALAGNERKSEISKLKRDKSPLYELYANDKRIIAASRHFYKNSGRFPLSSYGRVNYYAIFAEWMRKNLNDTGRMACIVPSGIVTDYSPRFFFQDLVKTKSLLSVFDFENHLEQGDKNEKFFDAVDSRFRFCLLSCGSPAATLKDKISFVFLARKLADLDNAEKLISFSQEDIKLFNPNTKTAPVFLSQKEFILAKAIYSCIPVLDSEAKTAASNPWQVQFAQGMFNMSSKSKFFRKKHKLLSEGWILNGNLFSKDGQKYLPIYEGKMIHLFNHRWASAIVKKDKTDFLNSDISQLQDPDYKVEPRYWIDEQNYMEKLRLLEGGDSTAPLTLPGLAALNTDKEASDITEPDDSQDADEQAFQDDEKSDQIHNLQKKYKWLIGFRGITNATNERTLVGGVFPLNPVGNSLLLFFSENPAAPYLPAFLSSLICDFLLRRKLSGTNFNKFHARQLPIPAPENLQQAAPWQSELSLAEWLKSRILELTFTTEELRPFALDLGYTGEPYPYDEQKRMRILAELDAAFFHLYLPCTKNGAWSEQIPLNNADLAALKENFPTARDALCFILDQFPLLANSEIKKFGCCKSRELILQAYDALTAKLNA